MTLGEKLTALRQKKKLTQKEFCQSFSRRFPDQEINRSQYSKWEGGFTMPDINHLRSLVTYYKVTADELIFDNRVPGVLASKLAKLNRIASH